jgi:hypothetical protein
MLAGAVAEILLQIIRVVMVVVVLDLILEQLLRALQIQAVAVGALKTVHMLVVQEVQV